MERENLTQITADYKRGEKSASVANGELVWIMECAELVDGRWEHYVCVWPIEPIARRVQ